MLGLLQEAGNANSPAHDLELLAGAGMLRGRPTYAGEVVFVVGSGSDPLAIEAKSAAPPENAR